MVNDVGRSALIALLCIGLSACLDLDQTFVVHNNGDAEFNFLVTIDAELLELADETDIDAEQACESDEFLDEDIPPTLKRVSESRVLDGDLLCEFTISGPLEEFAQLSTSIEQESHGADIFSLEILDDHRVRLISVYDFSDEDYGSAGDDAMAQSIKRMIFANFEGHHITWKIQAPAILESNGDIAADGRSVSWSLPLKDALVAGGEYRIEAVIDYKNTQSQFF